MTWRMICKPLETAETAVGDVPTVAQGFTLSSTAGHKILRKVVIGIFAHNPTFTTVVMELWSDNGGSPGKLIATSTNSKARANLLPTADNFGICFAFFNFADIPLRAGVKYWLAVKATGYTYSASAHIAWRHTWPDPQYQTGLTLTTVKGAKLPLEATLIMADL